MLETEEQKRIAKLINALIDIPMVPEDIEAAIFEHAVRIIDSALDDVLPEAFAELIRNSETGIDKDHAQTLANRLAEAVNQKVNLPYLNEEQEERVIRLVIDPIVKAMIDGRKLDDLLPRLEQPATPQ